MALALIDATRQLEHIESEKTKCENIFKNTLQILTI